MQHAHLSHRDAVEFVHPSHRDLVEPLHLTPDRRNSNSEVLVHALQPRGAIMNNGIRKGGQPETMKILYAVPGLEDVWQLHFPLLGGQEYAARRR